MSEDINFKEICSSVAEHLDENAEYVEGIANLMFAEILNEVMLGKRVKIPRFGFFSLKEHKSRKCSQLKNQGEKEIEGFAKLNFEACGNIRKEITDKFRSGTVKTFKK